MAVSGMDFGVVWKRIFEISFLVGKSLHARDNVELGCLPLFFF